ncbi:MAG: gamma-glutamyltransferase [Fidelibacterota bacterium]
MNNLISAGDRTTVEAGRVVLEKGGNAFDAAVGASFTAMVAEPALTSPGGGGHLMAHPVDRPPEVFDFFVNTPSGMVSESDLDFFAVDVDFGGVTQEFHTGKGSAAVPGNVAGLLAVHERLGRIPLAEVLEPAVVAAKEGVILSPVQAYLLKILTPILTHEGRGQALFAQEGEPLGEGDRLMMPALADFLFVLGREGADLMYRGEVANLICEWAKNGGLIVRKDLESYRVVERKPLRSSFRTYTALLNPPPAVSGLLVDFALRLLDAAGCFRTGSLPLKELVLAFEETDRIRGRELGRGLVDEDTPPLSTQPFFLDSVRRFRSLTHEPLIEGSQEGGGSTTHISVLDRQGNAASVTTTNGEGCGYVLPDAGFMLNNMLGEQDLSPGGFHRYPPGVRLPSMLAPTIVLSSPSGSGRGFRPVLLTGTAGSNRIRSVVVQILVNHLCKGMDLEKTTKAPRVHLEGDVLHVEPGIPERELRDLENRYAVERWEQYNLFFGGANSVTPEQAMGDPRRGGVSLIF